MQPMALQHVSVSRSNTPILFDITCSFSGLCGTLTAVTGTVGCGKSTLLWLFSTLETAHSGTILIGDKPLNQLTRRELREWRRRLGSMSQPLGLFDWLTATGSLSFVLEENGFSDPGGEKVEASLKSVGLWDQRHSFPRQLSGGQQKRLALARALILNPELLLLDDPAAGLDPVTGRSILALIAMQKSKSSILLATNDLATVLKLADSVIFLEKGRIHFWGGIAQFREASDPVLKQFFHPSLYTGHTS